MNQIGGKTPHQHEPAKGPDPRLHDPNMFPPHLAHINPFLAPRPGNKYKVDEEIPYEEQVVYYQGGYLCQGVNCYFMTDSLIKFRKHKYKKHHKMLKKGHQPQPVSRASSHFNNSSAALQLGMQM